MKEETRAPISTAIHGLMFAAGEIDRALLGKTRDLNARKSEHHGPFVQTLNRIAEIADGRTYSRYERSSY